MDGYWSDAERALGALEGVGDAYLPDEMRTASAARRRDYASFDATVGDDAVLVLHKGRLDEFDGPALRAFWDRARPVFANEVFAVLAGPAVAKDDVPAETALHLRGLRKALDALTAREHGPGTRSERTIRAAVSRMVPHLGPDGRPNVNDLWMVLSEINAIKWSVK